MAEGKHPLLNATATRERLTLEPFQGHSQSVEAAHQQILFVLKMCVERCTAHVGAIDDVLHRNRFESLLLDQRQHCPSTKLLTSLDPSIDWFRHLRPTTFRTIHNHLARKEHMAPYCAGFRRRE